MAVRTLPRASRGRGEPRTKIKIILSTTRAGTVSISPGLQTVGGEARAGLLNAVGGCNGTNATTMAPAPEAETQMYPPVVDEKPAVAGHEGRKSQHADRNNPDAKPWDSAE